MSDINKKEFEKLRKSFQAVVDALYNQRMLNQIGLAALRLIKTRTRQGKDIKGKKFKGGKGYSEAYKKKRQKHHLPVDVINLEFDDIDGMLQHLDYVIFRDLSGVALDINRDDKRQIAYYLNESGAGKNRIKFPFFGLNKKEEEKIAKLVQLGFLKELRKKLKKAQLFNYLGD